MKEYGVLYAKICFPKGHKLNWLGHCGIFDILPKDLKKEVITLSNDINEKWQESIVVPMDKKIMPGIITKPEVIEEVAKDIYNGMQSIMDKLVGETNCIRLVWGIGEMDQDWIENKTTSTHEVGNYPIMVKVGRTLEHGWEPGMFKVQV